LNDFLKSDYGLRTVQLLNFATPTWRERPDIVLDNIKIYVEKGAAFKIFDERKKAETRRKQAEKELLSKVPSDQREWFAKLMQMAQNWGWWSEEHEFWLNDHIYSLIRFTMLEYGKRFVQAGAFDKVEDIWHITEADFENTLHFPENFNLRPQVAKNRAELETYHEINSVPIVTYKGMDEALKWLISVREFHVALSMGYMPEPKEGVNASLWGTCGRPGTVEGPARVVKRDQDLLDVQAGDILVAPTTYVTWTPIFSKIAGLVVDRGGSLSHSAI
jgi:pyruvate,water dikinase